MRGPSTQHIPLDGNGWYTPKSQTGLKILKAGIIIGRGEGGGGVKRELHKSTMRSCDIAMAPTVNSQNLRYAFKPKKRQARVARLQITVAEMAAKKKPKHSQYPCLLEEKKGTYHINELCTVRNICIALLNVWAPFFPVFLFYTSTLISQLSSQQLIAQ